MWAVPMLQRCPLFEVSFFGGFTACVCVCAAVSVRQGHDNECGLAGLYVGCSKRA